MSTTKTATVTGRVNIPVSLETRSDMERIASGKGISLAELGRQALEAFLADEHRRLRLHRLRDTAIKYADIINGVGDDWSATETEGWQDD
jgi:hypothetical protein